MALVIPSILAAYRQSGIDFKAYESIYNHFANGLGYDIEIGWEWLNIISPSYIFLLFLSAFIFFGVSYAALSKVVDKHRDIAWFAYLITFHGPFFNGMRQMLASAFVFLGIMLLKEKKFFKFAVSIAVGTLFHTTAVIVAVFILLYLMVLKRFGHKEILTVVLTVGLLLSVSVLAFISSQLGVYEGYFSKDAGGVSLGFLLYSIPPIFFYYYRKKLFRGNRMLDYAMGLYLLIIPFQFLGMRIAYADRFMLYFQPFICVLVPHVIEKYETERRANLRGIYVVWFLIQYVFLNLILNGNGMYPYRLGM